jgi:hypothetical protein
MGAAGFEIEFLEDRDDPDHKPSGIYRCIVRFPGYDPIPCVGKVNANDEGETIGVLHSTILHPWLPDFHGIWASGRPEDDDFILLGDLRAGLA